MTLVHYLLAQGNQLSSLYLNLLARDIVWMLQGIENEKKKKTLKPREPRG